jgi:hypothetical protein
VKAQGFKMTGSQVSTTGVVIATYEPGEEIKSGSFVEQG